MFLYHSWFFLPIGLVWFQYRNLHFILVVFLVFFWTFQISRIATERSCPVPNFCLNFYPYASEVSPLEYCWYLKFSLSMDVELLNSFWISLYCLISLKLLLFPGLHLDFWSIFISSSLWQKLLSSSLNQVVIALCSLFNISLFNASLLSILFSIFLVFWASEKEL